MNFPPPDAVKEFNIQVQGFSAEYGRNAGSQVSVVSKSGTNQFMARPGSSFGTTI